MKTNKRKKWVESNLFNEDLPAELLSICEEYPHLFYEIQLAQYEWVRLQLIYKKYPQLKKFVLGINKAIEMYKRLKKMNPIQRNQILTQIEQVYDEAAELSSPVL